MTDKRGRPESGAGETLPAPQFSIIVPCFNEEDAVEETVRELGLALATDVPYELIAVNDGSTDRTKEILLRLKAEVPRLRVIEHGFNLGYGAALKTGMRQAHSPYIAITDADGTYPNERLGELFERCRDGEFDMVVGARIGENVTYSKLRAFPKYYLKLWVSWIARVRVPDINSGMRVFRKSAAEPFIGILPDGFSFTITITLSMLTTFRPVEFVPINYRRRLGNSKIKPIRDTIRFAKIILRTGIYFAPLRAFAPAILFFGIVSMLSLIWDIFREDLTEATLILFMFTLNFAMFALLADMIDKRSTR